MPQSSEPFRGKIRIKPGAIVTEPLTGDRYKWPVDRQDKELLGFYRKERDQFTYWWFYDKAIDSDEEVLFMVNKRYVIKEATPKR